MKRKELLWNMLSIMMAALLSMGLSACGDDDTPELTVSTTSINLKVDGDGDKDIIVSASHTDWNASVTEGSSWLKVDKKNGQLATVSVDENKTAEKRIGKVKIIATADASLSFDITVSQEGAEEMIDVNLKNIEFDAEGGSQTISIASNCGWTANTNQSWLSVNPVSGNTPSSGSSTSVVLTTSENKTNSERTCIVTFKTTGEKASVTVSVTQKKQTPYLLVNGLESTSLQFSPNSGVNYKQTVRVTSNVSWSLNGVPDWLSVSPTNGNGEISVDIYPKSSNDSDDNPRTVELVLFSGETRATIEVTQESPLDKDAYVNPTNIITLYNGIAFDYEFGKNVSYYYRGYMEKSSVGSMTDAEIISVLEDPEHFKRYTVSDDEVAVFSGLEEGRSYMVYTVGYNKEGKRGKLTRKEIVTKTQKSNEPMAWIDDPITDGSYWYWSIQKSATCYSYYMLSTEDIDFMLEPDVYQAWIIDYNMRRNNLSEYINGGNWSRKKTDVMVAVITWARDMNKNFASKIDFNIGVDNSSSSRKLQQRTKEEKVNKNYPKVIKSPITIEKKK